MSLFKLALSIATDIDVDFEKKSAEEQELIKRDEQTQKISLLMREYLEAKKPGTSKKSTNQAQIRVVSEWIRDEFLKSTSGNYKPIDAWIKQAQAAKPADRVKLLEEKIKGPVVAQVRLLMVA